MKLTERAAVVSTQAFGTTIPVRKSEPMEVTSSEDYQLFNIVEDAIPPMPSNLVQYDVEITNEIARTEARAVFQIWLTNILTGQTILDNDIVTVCNEVDNLEIFFPNWPYKEKFAEQDSNGKMIPGTEWNSIEYRRLYRLGEITTAEAKSECTVCPFRVQCLTTAIGFDKIIVDDDQVDKVIGVEGIWGGWGLGPREKISNQFHNLRRKYQAGRRSIEAGYEGKKKYKGMPANEIRAYEAIARKIKLNSPA